MILIDIGNTNIVFAVRSNNLLKKIIRINTYQNNNNLKNLINTITMDYLATKKIDNNKVAIISSVVPSLNTVFINTLKQNSIKGFIIKSRDIMPFLNIKYNLKEIGADRIANSIAIIKNKITNSIVIDFGTATTFDIIDSSGTYKGGLICPGIKLSIKSLNVDTAQLPLIKLKRTSKVVGRDTNSAIESGIYWGYVSLVEGLIDKIKNEMNFNNCTVIGTGGLSHIFKEDIKKINYFNDELTLKGLYLINNKINEKK